MRTNLSVRMEAGVLLNGEQFPRLPSPSIGLLVGLRPTGNVSHVVLGRCGCAPHPSPAPTLASLGLPAPHWEASWDSVKGCFPGGCGVCGVWVAVEEEQHLQEVVKELMNKTDLQAVVGDHPVLVVATPTSTDQPDTLQCYQLKDGSLRPVASSPVADYLSSHTLLLRATSSLSTHLRTSKTSKEEFLSQLPGSPLTFYLPQLGILLSHKHPSQKTLRQLLQSAPTPPSPLMVEVLQGYGGEGLPAPTISLSRPVHSVAQLQLPIDVLTIAQLDQSLSGVADCLAQAVQRQVLAVVSAMFWKEGSLYNVSVHHFPAPPHHLSPITVAFPHTSITSPDSPPLRDAHLATLRLHFHSSLCLPVDRPLLRLTNLTCFSPPLEGPHLLCPHTGLRSSPTGTVATVQGRYTYHHYMQDNFNDNGWGCAYRSLQTLWSWFKLQGYTSKPIPSHREIQEALVATGDKPSHFISSRQWIGSFEVSTTLNHLLAIESKIHHISSGEEMTTTGRVLLHHFQTQHCPVMIGGGVLAHTILGVDYNTSTGHIRFLVLDPHYTGRDDLRTVISKGWCGWKPASFWDKKAHYNMCMPQRPKEV